MKDAPSTETTSRDRFVAFLALILGPLLVAWLLFGADSSSRIPAKESGAPSQAADAVWTDPAFPDSATATDIEVLQKKIGEHAREIELLKVRLAALEQQRCDRDRAGSEGSGRRLPRLTYFRE